VSQPKAQIGYNYDSGNKATPPVKQKAPAAPTQNSDSESEEDLDVTLDIKNLTAEHKQIMNKCATNYGMQYGDYVRILIIEEEEKEEIRQNKILAAERAQFAVRLNPFFFN
jgi:hypothetical protein